MKRNPHWLTYGSVSFLFVFSFSSDQAFGQAGIYRFDDVRVVGNERMTSDEVLELCNEASLQSFDDAGLQRLVDCLGGSGKFKSVSLKTEGRDLVVQVSEAPSYTGFFDISASVDTERGASVRLELQDRDLFDRGLEGGFVLDLAQEEQSANASLADPDFLERGWRAGMSLGYNNVNYDDQSISYRRAVVSGFLGVPLDDRQELTFSLGFQSDEVYDVLPTASPILQRETGRRDAPFLALEYDAVFLPVGNPQTRLELKASQAFSGLGEDYFQSATRIRANVTAVAVPDRLNVSISVEGGHVESRGTAGPRVLDRFQLGGAALRGFAPRGVGPSDGGDHLGGESFAVASVETRSPLWSIGTTQIAGGMFAEAGSVWGLSDRVGFENPVDDAAKLRGSVGLSLTATIGRVPITMYYAKPVQSEASDKTQAFGLSMSSKF